jgi:hypothetical protein
MKKLVIFLLLLLWPAMAARGDTWTVDVGENLTYHVETFEQILPETDYYLSEKESGTVEIVEKESGYQVGIIICASLVMAGLMIIGIFCYLISVCSVYEKDKNNTGPGFNGVSGRLYS